MQEESKSGPYGSYKIWKRCRASPILFYLESGVGAGGG